MTREERLVLLKQIEKDIHVCSLESTFLDDAKSCAIHSVIEELEQEPFINKPCVSSGVCEHDKQKVLDKIRAEIEQLTSRYTISRERGGMGQVEWSDMLIKESEVLEIIDKYKAESEG